MDKLDQMAESVVTALCGVVLRSLEPLRKRLEAIEARQPEKGEPGEKGLDGKDAPPVDVEAIVRTVLDKVPEPLPGRDGRDGAPGPTGNSGQDGKNGKDGAALIDLKGFGYDMETREFVLLCVSSDGAERQLRTFAPLPVYRGVLRSGMTAKHGEIYTWGGSMWQAKRDTNKAPPGDDWICCVQRGKDGKDAE